MPFSAFPSTQLLSELGRTTAIEDIIFRVVLVIKFAQTSDIT